MKKSIVFASLAASLLAGNATAATYSSFTQVGTTYGNSAESSGGGLSASAWSNSATGGVIEDAYVGVYSGTLGVSNRTEGINVSAPNHATDSSGKNDVLLLHFVNGPVNLTSIGIGYAREDRGRSTCTGDATYCYRADIALLAYTGNGAPVMTPGKTFSDLLAVGGGWEVISLVSNVAQNSTVGNGLLNNLTTTNSSYWMVGAYSSTFGANADSKADYFKLASIGAVACVSGTPGCTEPPSNSGVPEPGSLVLVGAALTALVRSRHLASA